jgi:hypothetical protein
MRLTLDSSEPLEDAIHVLGALYGVTLVVSTDAPETRTMTQQSTAPANRSASEQQRTGAAVAGAVVGKSRRPSRSRSAPDVSNADVRSWARETGLTVSERGRVPASVMTAYRSAHQ